MESTKSSLLKQIQENYSHNIKTIPLPEELILHIFSYLDPISLGNVSMVNHTFDKISVDKDIWETLMKKDYPEAYNQKKERRRIDWKWAYTEEYITARKSIINLVKYPTDDNLRSFGLTKDFYQMNTLIINLNLQKDKFLFKNIVQMTPAHIMSAHPDIKKNKKFIIELISKTKGAIFKYLDQQAKDGKLFQVEDESLHHIKEDRDVVQAAVKENGLLLEYAPKFNNDEDIVNLAIENDSRAFEFASSKFRNNPKLALSVVERDPKNLNWIHKDLANNLEFACTLIKIGTPSSLIIKNFSINILKDLTFIKIALEYRGNFVKYINHSFYEDQKLAKEILSLIFDYNAEFKESYFPTSIKKK